MLAHVQEYSKSQYLKYKNDWGGKCPSIQEWRAVKWIPHQHLFMTQKQFPDFPPHILPFVLDFVNN